MPERIQIVTNLEKNEKLLKDAWASFNKIPTSFDLAQIFNWWNRFGKVDNNKLGYNKSIIIVLIFNDNILRGILPLMSVERKKKKIIKIRSLEFLSQSFCGDYLDVIQNDITTGELNEAFCEIRKFLKHDFINLSYLPSDSKMLECDFRHVFLHSGKVIIPIKENYEKIRQNIYSKNLRHILNKFIRRIGESDQNIQSFVFEGKNEISQFKKEIRNVSLSKLSETGKHSIYEDREMGEQYFESIVNEENPFCSVFLADNRLLSYNMGYIKQNVVYALDAAYNRQYAESQKIGFGILAYDNLVSHFAGKYKLLDMGFGLDDYKFRFSMHVEYTRTVLMKGNTIKAIFLFNNLLRNYQKNNQQLLKRINKND